ALAAGVPVIATDVPACREVLDGNLGELLPPQKPDALAQAMLRAMKQAPATPSQSTVDDAYGVGQMARKYLDVLNLEI
ncbi:MAG: glycosyltransferase, partial [Pseudomonadota bacterium]